MTSLCLFYRLGECDICTMRKIEENKINQNRRYTIAMKLLLPAAMVLTDQYMSSNIRITCPCNVYPLEPHFYIAKLGYGGVYLFFLCLL